MRRGRDGEGELRRFITNRGDGTVTTTQTTTSELSRGADDATTANRGGGTEEEEGTDERCLKRRLPRRTRWRLQVGHGVFLRLWPSHHH